MMRLDKFLSEAGAGSRKEIKAMVKAKRITVDGEPARAPEQKVDENGSVVALDGRRVTLRGRVVLLLNKPAGYVTSTSDPRDPTVMELLPQEYQDLFPVGRLDKETEGLLLFTNDGDLGHRLTAPKQQVEKEYYAEIDGDITSEDILAFAAGILLRDGTRCLPASLRRGEKPQSCYVIVHEGKYHQVRRMLASRSKPVTYLRRQRESGLTLDGLKRGEFRVLSEEEIEGLL